MVLDGYLNSYIPLGTVLTVDCGEKIILNCITQCDYKRKDAKMGSKFVSYEAVDMAMQNMANWISNTDEPISMPKIGAGLGGGHWPVIEAIIDHRLKDFSVHIYLGIDPKVKK
jgi:hypothetical protein